MPVELCLTLKFQPLIQLDEVFCSRVMAYHVVWNTLLKNEKDNLKLLKWKSEFLFYYYMEPILNFRKKKLYGSNTFCIIRPYLKKEFVIHFFKFFLLEKMKFSLLKCCLKFALGIMWPSIPVPGITFLDLYIGTFSFLKFYKPLMNSRGCPGGGTPPKQ